MSADGLDRVQAVFNAVAKITSGDEEGSLSDARCPKCKASSFVDLPDLYTDAASRLEEHPDQANVAREGGLSDAQIVAGFAPPQRKSALFPTLAVGVPLGAAAAYVYQRFGPNIGMFAALAAGVVTVVVLLTSLRRVSDDYYKRRRQWRSRYMCRRCGQLVEV
jgi:hypothetical protein